MTEYTEREIADAIAGALQYGEPLDATRSIQTFEGAGVMTYNDGLVLTLEDGTEYQITVVRSR